jgi:predicted transcriptional regulator
MTLRPITIRIPEDLNNRLGYAAIDRKTTKQAIVIEALEAWFEKKKEEEKMEKLITAET